MQPKNDLAHRLKEFGLTPESCIDFLHEDFVHHKMNFATTKGLMNHKTRVMHEVTLLQRELLLRALGFSGVL